MSVDLNTPQLMQLKKEAKRSSLDTVRVESIPHTEWIVFDVYGDEGRETSLMNEAGEVYPG